MPNQNNSNQQSNNDSANNDLSSGGGVMGYTSPYSNQLQAPFTKLTPPTNSSQAQLPEKLTPPEPQSNEPMDLQSFMSSNSSNAATSTQANNPLPQQPSPQSPSTTANTNQAPEQITPQQSLSNAAQNSSTNSEQASQLTSKQANNSQQQQSTNGSANQDTNSKSDNLLDDPDQVQEILTNGEAKPQQDQPVVINEVQEVSSQSISDIPAELPTQPLKQANEQNSQQVNNNTQANPQVPQNLGSDLPQIGINAVEIPEFLQNTAQSQKEIQEEIRKQRDALEKKKIEDQARLEAERMRQQTAYQAPQQKKRPDFNDPMQTRQSQPLAPDRDLMPAANAIPVAGSNKKFSQIAELLDLVISQDASDLHLTVGYPPFIRIDDKLIPVGGALGKEEVKAFVSQSLTQNQKELLEVNREVDLSYQHKNAGRFRINAYYERGNMAAAYRLIPQKIRSTTELGLPSNILDFTRLSQGLFLVTGPTGSGKSTTLAAMLQYINETTQKHIITVEDPIEYVYPRGMSLVDQRELGSDTHDWSIALKSALRQDPDVILIGELRDFETIQAAITLAETGHLVFATLHTNSASQSIDRIIDVFPPHQQQQIKTQLAGALKGILSQRLVPLIGGGRKAVIELLIVTPAVQNLIREGKTYQMDNVVATSADLGMISLEKSLVKLVRDGKITAGTAQDYAIRPEEVLKLMKNNQY